MQIDITQLMSYPREKLWETMLDPEVMARVLPGVEKFEVVGPDKYAVQVKLGVPSVKGTYTGNVEIFDKQEPESFRLRGDGKGTPGWARGEVLLTLTPEGDATSIRAKANATIGGTIAGVAQRMMEGVAKSMARDFFAALDRELQARK
ncbi:MAG TPA: carbon monoxide dehydrogenase subunit G [Candidatus Binataceae bacterium]|nr:carbon monoxide dehydrogenase subunit G [Candidatus Binataceae bacterium]